MSELLELFYQDYSTTPYIFNTYKLMISLGYTLILGLFMMYIYKSIQTSLSYNRRYAITLFMLSFISTVLIAIVQNNPLLSLGALGALSICRIRTNTKDPRDIGFVFWALSIGISSAVGAFSIGLISSLCLGLFLYLTQPRQKRNALLMVVRGSKDRLSFVQNFLQSKYSSTIQSKNIFQDSFELVYELHLKQEEEEALVANISNMEGISTVNVLAPSTKVM